MLFLHLSFMDSWTCDMVSCIGVAYSLLVCLFAILSALHVECFIVLLLLLVNYLLYVFVKRNNCFVVEFSGIVLCRLLFFSIVYLCFVRDSIISCLSRCYPQMSVLCYGMRVHFWKFGIISESYVLFYLLRVHAYQCVRVVWVGVVLQIGICTLVPNSIIWAYTCEGSRFNSNSLDRLSSSCARYFTRNYDW